MLFLGLGGQVVVAEVDRCVLRQGGFAVEYWPDVGARRQAPGIAPKRMLLGVTIRQDGTDQIRLGFEDEHILI